MPAKILLSLLLALLVSASAAQPPATLPASQHLLLSQKTAVFFQDDQAWIEIQPVPIGKNAQDVATLPLVITGKSVVQFEGETYPLEREGLYRFIKLPTGITNLISRKNDNSLLPVLQALSQLHIHGKRDEHLEDPLAKIKSATSISRTCGPISNLAYTVLRKQAGFWPRSIATLTADELSGFDDGHQMLEVYDPNQKKWILVDIDMGYIFRADPRGPDLSALEFWQILHDAKPFHLVKLSTKEIDPNFPYALYSRIQSSTPERTKAWYQRVCQIISIDGKAFATNPDHQKRVTDLWGKDALLPQPDWQKTYYKPVQ